MNFNRPQQNEGSARAGSADEYKSQHHSDWSVSLLGCLSYRDPYADETPCVPVFVPKALCCPGCLIGENSSLLEMEEFTVSGNSSNSARNSCLRLGPFGAKVSVAMTTAMVLGWWPILWSAAFVHRRRILKKYNFLPESESSLTTLLVSCCCLPCSLFQMNVFLDEHSHLWGCSPQVHGDIDDICTTNVRHGVPSMREPTKSHTLVSTEPEHLKQHRRFGAVYEAPDTSSSHWMPPVATHGKDLSPRHDAAKHSELAVPDEPATPRVELYYSPPSSPSQLQEATPSQLAVSNSLNPNPSHVSAGTLKLESGSKDQLDNMSTLSSIGSMPAARDDRLPGESHTLQAALGGSSSGSTSEDAFANYRNPLAADAADAQPVKGRVFSDFKHASSAPVVSTPRGAASEAEPVSVSMRTLADVMAERGIAVQKSSTPADQDVTKLVMQHEALLKQRSTLGGTSSKTPPTTTIAQDHDSDLSDLDF